jgi:Zn-dependent protease with chaperone function
MVIFAIAVLLTVAVIVGLLVLVLANSDEPPQGSDWFPIIGISSAVVLGVIALASFWRIASLSRGGGALARALGAVQVSADTQVPRLRRLRNVVEEMSIASGVPVPELYLLEHEAGINAFAAGFSPADAAVCVTSGALDKLSRDELQGVIAHEFSHVLNGDMRINLRLVGWLFGLLMLGVIGRHMMQARGSEKEGMAIAIAGVAIWLVGSLGLLFGRLIKASISRKREFLADASAVQYTRQTTGLVGALKKAAALPAGTKLTAGEGEEVAHMLFGDGVGYGALFATHPPLTDRIRRLDPRFDPKELQRLGALIGRGELQSGDDSEGALGVVQLLAPAVGGLRIQPQQVAELVGQTHDPHLMQAREIRRQLSPVLKLAARSVEHAPALIFALLLDPRQEDLRQQQRMLIGEQQGHALVHRSMELFAVLQSEQIDERLPLAQLCFPTLKRRPAGDLRGIVDTVYALVHVDGEVAVFEYCLATMLEHLLRDAESPKRAGEPGRLALRHALAHVSELLAVVAVLGGTDSNRVSAYAAGAARITGLSPDLPPVTDWRASMDRCLPVLDQLNPVAKPELIAALTATLLHDGVLSVEEGELLRTICASLHCPLPPLIDTIF